ncbi:hypothetical protein C1646_666109 [Rhizophagus diaphanus]|nr:hypothetical protein C1646_666109 [Rhizophagus diaphanus] [Rhizophagus sp. MUCL 43196]
MWELASGVPAFYNIPEDQFLTIDICKGERPRIKEGTMPEEYEELMKRCWDNDPEKRPTAKKLRLTFMEWKHEPKTTCQPEAHYVNRKYDSSSSSSVIYENVTDKTDYDDCMV